jgi:hypothetical protein
LWISLSWPGLEKICHFGVGTFGTKSWKIKILAANHQAEWRHGDAGVSLREIGRRTPKRGALQCTYKKEEVKTPSKQ